MTTITYSYTEYDTQAQRTGICSTLTEAAAVAIAIDRLDATELESGDYIYWPEETPGQAYVVDAEELARLGAALHCVGGHDVYSLWCAETGHEATDAEMAEAARG